MNYIASRSWPIFHNKLYYLSLPWRESKYMVKFIKYPICKYCSICHQKYSICTSFKSVHVFSSNYHKSGDTVLYRVSKQILHRSKHTALTDCQRLFGKVSIGNTSVAVNTEDWSNGEKLLPSGGGGGGEGPVMHISPEAALVITNNNNGCSLTFDHISTNNPDQFNSSSSENAQHATLLRNAGENDAPPSTADQPHSSPVPLFIFDNQVVSSDQLLSHTVAFVRKVQQLDDNASLASDCTTPDVEYVVHRAASEVLSQRVGPLVHHRPPPESTGWRPINPAVADLPGHYASLAKSRLTALVVATALGGYVLAPGALSAVTFGGVVLGTGLISAAANATNQILEVPYDSQMKRTNNRVLVKGHLSPLHAACFAGACGVSGVGLLLGTCNPLTASLGAANLLLYTGVYTPMKRLTIANTWMGAVVGAIPPLMGWCASSGSLIGPEAAGAWVIAGLLFAWQFPHFNALSWNLRADYSKAGYRMMCVTNPRLCKATCVRYSLAMLGLGIAAPALDVTTWTFAADCTPLNAIMLYLSYRFYRDGDSRSSRNLFRFSLVHLPAVIVLMIISKKYSKDGHHHHQQQQQSDTHVSKVLCIAPAAAEEATGVTVVTSATTATGSTSIHFSNHLVNETEMQSQSAIRENSTISTNSSSASEHSSDTRITSAPVATHYSPDDCKYSLVSDKLPQNTTDRCNTGVLENDIPVASSSINAAVTLRRVEEPAIRLVS